MPSPTVKLTAGQFENGIMSGFDTNNNPAGLSALVGTISDNTNAYLATVPANGKTAYCVVARNTLPTGATTIAVSWSGKSLDGNSISDVESYELDGATPPPQAVTIGKQSSGTGSGPTPAGDPGTTSVTFI